MISGKSGQWKENYLKGSVVSVIIHAYCSQVFDNICLVILFYVDIHTLLKHTAVKKHFFTWSWNFQREEILNNKNLFLWNDYTIM